MRKIARFQRGDTIIEVLLAMAVIGLVLGAAYGIANRSVTIGRNAQERSEALKHAESQIELLKQYVSEQDLTPGDTVMDMLVTNLELPNGADSSACFSVDSATDEVVINKVSDSFASPGNECERGGLYQITVVCTSGLTSTNSSLIAKINTCGSMAPVALSERKITVRVVWERLGGGTMIDDAGNEVPSRDSLDLYYRYGG